MRSPGLFNGELIISVDETNRYITIALMATKPNLELFSSCFRGLCKRSFEQCIFFYCFIHHFVLIKPYTESKESICCPECIKGCFSKLQGGMTLVGDIGAINNSHDEQV